MPPFHWERFISVKLRWCLSSAFSWKLLASPATFLFLLPPGSTFAPTGLLFFFFLVYLDGEIWAQLGTGQTTNTIRRFLENRITVPLAVEIASNLQTAFGTIDDTISASLAILRVDLYIENRHVTSSRRSKILQAVGVSQNRTPRKPYRLYSNPKIGPCQLKTGGRIFDNCFVAQNRKN